MIQLFRTAHEEELSAFVNGLSESELERRFELPFLQTEPTVAEGLTQVVYCTARIIAGSAACGSRENGAKPPTLDYILWTR